MLHRAPEPVASPADPRLAPYANLKDSQLRRAEFEGRTPAFICESELVVRALLESDWPVHSVLCDPATLPRLEPAILAARAARAGRDDADFPVFTAGDDTLHAITGFAFHRGVLAAGLRRTPLALDALLDRARVLLVLEGLSNHDNVGAIFRNAAALAGDAAGVILDPHCCDPLYRKAVRVSVGHVLRVPWSIVQPITPTPLAVGEPPANPLLDTLAHLRARGVRTIALSPRADATPIADLRDQLRAQSKTPVALLLGAEGPGLTAAAMDHADVLCKIPMAKGVDSLNVATTAAIALSWLA